VCTRIELIGLDNIPKQGPALFVANHLGDTDAVTGIAYFPRYVDALAKVELYDLPVVGQIGELYGVIWVHRGRPDRRALRAALEALHAGRFVAIAPEGRESTTGKLEEGVGGAAYLAVKAQVPVVPIAFTGTENWRIYGNLKKFRRTDITMTVGPAFTLAAAGSLREAIDLGTATIMTSLARLLPPGYRGRYAENVDEADGQR
jgi:1-acyl-sn-glycerol-3-phosphate acyltransferase